MFSLWLCLFFTYLFTTHAIEKPDDGDVFGEKPSAQLEDLGSFTLINRILSSVLSQNASNKSEDNLQELLRTIKLPGSSVIKEIANATENAFLKIHPFTATDNLFKKLIQPMLNNLTPKRKRQADASNDQLNVDESLPINRLLAATDKLFNRTAFIDKMLDKEENRSEKTYEHVYINNRDLAQDHEFAPIPKEDEPKEVDERYSALLEKIFTNPLKSDSVQSVNQENAQSKQNLTVKSRFFGLSKNNGDKREQLDGGPLASAASLLLEKIKNVILNVVQKLQDDKKISGRVFAVSALTSFSLSVGVSATKAFYTGYAICEFFCRLVTGQNGLVTCNLFGVFRFPITIVKNSVSKISNLFSIGKNLLKFPTSSFFI